MKYYIRLLLPLLLFSLLPFKFIKAQTPDSSLILGVYSISKVIDGDTFKFEGLDDSGRLLCIDTEETFKGQDALQKTSEVSKVWRESYQSVRDSSKMPVKTQSPFGYKAWQWAKDFMDDVKYVRLERDNNERTVGTFGRSLVYVIAYKDGKEIDYNVECVRQGYSPYFNKYGDSKRFHDEFVEAQNYAKENKLGIWSSTEQCYPDYDERITWWNERARQMKYFEDNYSVVDNYINLYNDDAYSKLENLENEEVIVFGSISDVLMKNNPYLIRIPYTDRKSFDVVVYEEDANLLNELNIEELQEYNVYVKGTLAKYKEGYQIVLKNKDQIWME